MKSRKRSLTLAVAFLFFMLSEIIGCSVVGADLVSDDSWSMFRHDPAHSSYSRGLAPSGVVEQLWNFTIDSGMMYAPSSPVVVDGYVFVGYDDGNVYSFDAGTGVLVWSFATGDFGCSSPAVVGGRVFVGSGKGIIYCLNAVSGVQIWNSSVQDLSDESVNAPLTVVGNRVFVGSGLGNVFCFDAETGEKIWNYSTGSRGFGSPAFSGGYVYVGNNEGGVYCLNASDGVRIWDFKAGGSVYSPTVEDGDVYVGSADGNVYCLDASNGVKRWNYTTEYNSNGPSHNYHWGNTVSDPAVAYGYVYVGSSDFLIYCLDGLSGSQVWNFTTGAEVYAAPAVADGCVFAGSYDGKLYCLNAYNGSEIWSYPVGVYSPVNAAGSAGSPAVVEGVVYVVGQGILYALGSPLSSSSLSSNSFVEVTIIIVIVALATIVGVYRFKKGKKIV